MKIKFLCSTLVLLIVSIIANAAIVDLQTARTVAKNAFYEKASPLTTVSSGNISISKIWIEKENQEPVFYIFNFEDDGFIIISAEDAMPPVLGYSPEGICSDIGIDANFDSFMQNFSSQILLIRSKNIQATPEIVALWDIYSSANFKISDPADLSRGVTPLLTCTWNQNYPYNMLCPEDGIGPGGHVYAGCVATAMSMVMYYWRYPLQGQGSHNYYYPPYGNISANFGETQYLWNQMKDAMDPAYEDVALIQFHCGVGVDMMYSPSGSGAYSWDVPPAITNYFGYSEDAAFLEKDNYSLDAWINILKEQINQSQPMYYSGYSNSGGHAFVCDGYDENDYFHYNFGWSGQSNGYYTLYSVGGYNEGQGAVVNFIPGSGYPYYFSGLQTLSAKSGSFEDGSGPKENYAADTEVSWLIDPQEPGDSISMITLKFSRFDLAQNDEVTVYDGESATANILAVLTGTTLPATINSTGNKMLVVFKSNETENANGFLASYSTTKPIWCAGLDDLTEPMANVSDGSAQFNYYNSTVCMWRIQPENATTTTMYFTAFDTEEGVDVVKVYDLGTQQLLAEYSGTYSTDNLPAPVTSPSGKLFIAFSTNNSVAKAGWEGYYVANTVGIGEIETINPEISVYPNPATTVLNIGLKNFEKGDILIKVVSMDGNVFGNWVENLKNDEMLISIPIEKFPQGIYLLSIRQSNRLVYKKITIQ